MWPMNGREKQRKNIDQLLCSVKIKSQMWATFVILNFIIVMIKKYT